MKKKKQILTTMRLIIALMMGLGVSACVGNPVSDHANAHSVDSSLNLWLEKDAIPYLRQQFGQHPRFKGQPILLVRMQGDNVQPRIDELTEQIRDTIIDALLKEPGLNFFWRPAVLPWQHHQSFEDADCSDYQNVHYYIGIDCGLSKVNGNLYVKVRALNLTEHKWVSGFGKTWQGEPMRNQLAALEREHPDPYLRGLRPLPFTDQQPDLLAAYLARNLSCLLRQGSADDLVVHVPEPAGTAPGVFKTALDLVGKYLARFREVEVTDDLSQANVSVVAAIHSIHQNLHQIWVSARYLRGEKYLPGVETEAYVLIENRMQYYVAGSQSGRITAPSMTDQSISADPKLIASFDLLTPRNQRLCPTGMPWRSGIQRIQPDGHLKTGSCLAVEVRLAKPAFVFLVGQDAAGKISHLFPSDCPDLGVKDARHHPGQLFQFPSLSDPDSGILEVSGHPGKERVYAIAITTPELADQFAGQMSEIQGLCRPGKMFPSRLLASNSGLPHDRVDQWQDYLNDLSHNNPGLVQWREIGFWHEN